MVTFRYGKPDKTSLEAAIAADEEGGGVTMTISDTDPGAIGAGLLWLEVVFGDENLDGGNGRLWVRNSTDDGWNSVSPMSWGDASTTLVASPEDNAELSLADSGGSQLTDPTKLLLRGSVNLTLDAVGVHLGGAAGPALMTGALDPSNGAGVAAPIGSMYLRVDLITENIVRVWLKIGAADNAWVAMVSAGPNARGLINLVGLLDENVSLQAHGTGEVRLLGAAVAFNGDPIGTQAAAVADLDLTVTDPPTQAEVQAIADKMDELLAAMRASDELAT